MSFTLSIKQCVFIMLVYLWIECHTWKIVSRQKMEGHVVNGVFSSISMFPYMALITASGSVHCGGTVVSQRVILTAAHCLGVHINGVWLDYAYLDVFLGSATAMKGKKYKVCSTLPHEYFKIGGLDESFDDNDIGLILLKKMIKLGPTVQIANISTNSRWKKKDIEVTVIGFGSTQTIKGAPSQTLQMTRQKYVDEKTCYNTQHDPSIPNEPLTDRFCLIGERWNGACFGDSGSPVIWKSTVVGVVSSGRATFCGSDMMPTTHTDVAYYYKWIRDNINYLESGEQKCWQKVSKKTERDVERLIRNKASHQLQKYSNTSHDSTGQKKTYKLRIIL